MANRKNTSSRKRTAGAGTPTLRITRRFVNTKRHTVGYMVGGQRKTVLQTTKLARQGRIRNVRVVGRHVQANVGAKPLSSLPTTVSS